MTQCQTNKRRHELAKKPFMSFCSNPKNEPFIRIRDQKREYGRKKGLDKIIRPTYQHENLLFLLSWES